MSKNITRPLITIGITCYNAPDTIARALTGALSQTWTNFEIVIVDDCSTDNSVEVIENTIAKHSNINLIKHDNNQGTAGARQTILDNSKGEFIAFFDDDDETLPDRITSQYQRIVSYETQTGEGLIACYASGTRLYSNAYELELNAIGSRPEVPIGLDVVNYLLFYSKKSGLFYGSGTPTCSLMARATTFEQTGGFDPAFRRVEDVDFAIRLALANGHFIGCPEKLFIQHATNAQDKAPEKNLAAELQLAEKYKDYLVSVGCYEYAKRWPLIRYHHFANHHGLMLKELFALFVRSPIKVATHFLHTAPRRLIHEIKMKGVHQQ